MRKEVDEYLDDSINWQNEMRFLRSIVLNCGLVEEFKWRQPCYTHNGKNIAIISSFKRHAFISFFKGSLLSDTSSVLVSPGENSNSARLIPFTELSEIQSLEGTIKEYVFEAIEIENLGLEVKKTELSEFEIPDELNTKLKQSPDFKTAFESLTPGRQKGYLLHFSQAKQSATRASRIEKYVDRILKGYGIRDCICGHSKRMPNCDGSHKLFD